MKAYIVMGVGEFGWEDILACYTSKDAAEDFCKSEDDMFEYTEVVEVNIE